MMRCRSAWQQQTYAGDTARPITTCMTGGDLLVVKVTTKPLCAVAAVLMGLLGHSGMAAELSVDSCKYNSDLRDVNWIVTFSTLYIMCCIRSCT